MNERLSESVPGLYLPAWHRVVLFFGAVILLLFASANEALAHAVAEGDKGYIQEITGIHLLSFVYLGAKHMATGYDHILFLLLVLVERTPPDQSLNVSTSLILKTAPNFLAETDSSNQNLDACQMSGRFGGCVGCLGC